jgi:hypothetical protein
VRVVSLPPSARLATDHTIIPRNLALSARDSPAPMMGETTRAEPAFMLVKAQIRGPLCAQRTATVSKAARAKEISLIVWMTLPSWIHELA